MYAERETCQSALADTIAVSKRFQVEFDKAFDASEVKRVALSQSSWALKNLKDRLEALVAASELSPETSDALLLLDRSALSEISNSKNPPASVRQAVEIVWIFIEIWGMAIKVLLKR